MLTVGDPGRVCPLSLMKTRSFTARENDPVMLDISFTFHSLIDNCLKFRSNLGIIRYILGPGIHSNPNS